MASRFWLIDCETLMKLLRVLIALLDRAACCVETPVSSKASWLKILLRVALEHWAGKMLWSLQKSRNL